MALSQAGGIGHIDIERVAQQEEMRLDAERYGVRVDFWTDRLVTIS